MGLLGIPTNSNASLYHKHNYTNPDAVERLIRYVTRAKGYENRRDLLFYGAVGATCIGSAEDIIQQFRFVQHAFDIERRGGKRMYHEVFNMTEEEEKWIGANPKELWNLAMECAGEYYRLGFQVVFGAHWKLRGHCHFHFAVNSISFVDGKKWHTSLAEIKQREALFNRILYNHHQTADGKTAAIYFGEVPERARYDLPKREE